MDTPSPDERATLMSAVMSGIVLANVINLPLAGGLCATGIDGGWPMIFYVPGIFFKFDKQSLKIWVNIKGAV